MQLPIDFKALIDEATNIKAAQSTEISVSVYIDEAAPADVAAHVRSAFASTLPTARITVSYLDESFFPHDGDDFAVIVAGVSAGVGPAATALRAVGVPVMVVTTLPGAVAEIAESVGYAIPQGDLVSPGLEVEGERGVETVVVDERIAADLDERMGRWVVAVCREKRLAMSIAFPFMRRSLAKDAVQATSVQNAGIGLVPILPGADLPVMTLNQAKMVLQIAAAYGQEMDKNRAKELAGVVGGAYLCRVVARELAEFVPVLGFAIKPTIAYGGTAAIGNAAIEYFEGGEDAAGVLNVASKAADAGKRFVERVREQGPAGVGAGLLGKAQMLGSYVPVIQNAVEQYGPRVVELVDEIVASVMAQSRAGAR